MGVKRGRLSGVFGGWKTGCASLVGCAFLPTIVCSFLAFFFVPRLNLKLLEYLSPGTEAFMLGQLSTCISAKQALGKKRRFEWGPGFSSFTHSWGSGDGSLSYDIPVEGATGRGRLVIDATTSGGKRTVQRALLTVDRVQVNLPVCARYDAGRQEQWQRFGGKHAGSKKTGKGKKGRKGKRSRKGKKSKRGRRR